MNGGNSFPTKYDRRHDFSFVVSHELTKSWDVSATWVYGTGNAITFPQAVYFDNPGNNNINILESYGDRNSTRLPPNHRLDIGFSHTKKKKKYNRTVSFGAYNVYNRNNPFFAYLTTEDDLRVAKQVSLFPIIPSISYRIQF